MLHPQEMSLKLGDKELVFSPLTYRDWEDFSTACQYEPYNRLKNLGASQAELDKALDHCMTKEPTQQKLDAFATSLAGQRELIYLSLRKRQPDLTRIAVSEMFTLKDGETIKRIAEFIQKTSLPDVETGVKNGAGVEAGR